MFVIYKIDSQEDEPYDTFSDVYTSYLDCLEAGIIKALNLISVSYTHLDVYKRQLYGAPI